jgi:hypothetical protein
MDKLSAEIRQLLADWLQFKDTIIFTDDEAINQVTDELVAICKAYHEAKLKDEMHKFRKYMNTRGYPYVCMDSDIDEYFVWTLILMNT